MGRQESPLLKLCSSLDSEHSGPSTLGEHVRDYSVWPEQSWCPPEGLPGPEARAGSVLRASVGQREPCTACTCWGALCTLVGWGSGGRDLLLDSWVGSLPSSRQ